MMPEYLSTDPNAGEEIDAPAGSYLSDDPGAGEPEPIGRTGLAARPAVMRPGEEQPWYEGAWDAARQAIFGHPDREEARAAGVGLHPTTAEMVETGLAGASMVAGLGTARMALGTATGVRSAPYVARAAEAAAPYAGRAAAGVAGAGRAVARAGAAAVRHPLVGPVVAAALPGALTGNFEGALTQAAIAAATGGRGPAGRATPPRTRSTPRPSRRAASAPLSSGESAPAPRGPEPFAGVMRNQQGDVITPYGQSPPRTTTARAQSAPAQTAPPAATPPARQPSTPAPDPGRAAAQAHGNLMSFAKDVAAKNPKVGEKIWMQLDEAGNPVRYLTPDQAGAATRAGQSVTWVKNLWSRGA